jgi:hypothetical protein
MSALIKSFVKQLPHPLVLRIHHYYDLRRKSALAHAASKITGLPLLSTLELGSIKTSDTVFVLGSGWSINEISNRRWKAISLHDSIALNLWPIHPFVPRIYLFENTNQSEGLIHEAFLGVFQKRAADYREVVKIISEIHSLSAGQLVFEMPPGFRPNLYVGYSTTIAAQTEREFISGIRYLRGHGIFDPENHIHWHFKQAGSVVTAISLAARMNYRRIVLCGIDLGKAEYFYHHSERYPEASEWEFTPRDQPHLTARRFSWGLPASVVIRHLKQEVLDPAGIELFVENRSSTLFPHIPEIPPQLFEDLAGAPASAGI